MWTELAFAVGVMLAQADLPNANLPGNSPSLPNSNMIGSLPTDHPVNLPLTDTSPMAQSLRDLDDQARERAQRFDEANVAQVQTMQLAAKALEESQRARAEAAEDRQQLLDALQQRQP